MSPSKTFLRRLVPVSAMACGVALAMTAALPAKASPASPTRAHRTTVVPGCTTSGLVIWLDTKGGSTAGSTYYHLEFTNLSGHTCSLYGYPGVSAVDLAGHQLGGAATWDTGIRPTHVTLASGTNLSPIGSGDTATVILRITDVWNYPSPTCDQVTAAGLRVYAPDQAAAKIVPFPFTGCLRTGPAYLQVEAVQEGIPQG